MSPFPHRRSRGGQSPASGRLWLLLSVLGLGLVPGQGTAADNEARIAETAVTDVGAHAFGRSLKNLDPDHWLPMRAGKRIFTHAFRAAGEGPQGLDGLGPLFNASSCHSCHFRDGRGRPPQRQLPLDGTIDHMAPVDTPVDAPAQLIFRLAHGDFKTPDPELGHQLQDLSLPNARPEGAIQVDYRRLHGTYADGLSYQLRRPEYRWSSGEPAPGTRISPRVAPTLIGMGLLEAVPDAVIEQWHDPEDTDRDGISGMARRLTISRDGSATGESRLGRFGWKADQPDLTGQTLAALEHDMGISADELAAEHLESLVLYLRVLAPPAPRNLEDPGVQNGRRLFHEIGCASCHRPRLRTAEQTEGPAELARQLLFPYTDLLLHDMGPELADAGPAPEAGADPLFREWRTPPLWGLGLLNRVNGNLWLMHDGRARSFEEAILWHGGEGASARDLFSLLAAQERQNLVDFLKSL